METVGFEDLTRLMHELAEGKLNSIDSDRWCELKGVDPDALQFVINGLVFSSHHMIEEQLHQMVEEKTDEIMEAVAEGEDPVIGVGVNVDLLIGIAAFNAFVVGWEAATQFRQPTVLPEVDG